ncbi:MAG: helix-turn-helix transcriptional regulator [Bacteroidota bacterium]
MHNQHKILRVLQLIALLKARPAKSMRHLGDILESSERTVYRYLDLLEAVGFKVARDNGNRVYIEDENANGDTPSFTAEETRFLHNLAATVGRKHKLRDSVLRKLKVNSELSVAGSQLLQARLGVLVEKIADAMRERKQVVLKNYHSVNSNDIRDRLVEPIRFTDNYEHVVAYEIASGKNKHFHIERIQDVTVKRTSFRHAGRHRYTPTDVFGFADQGNSYAIDITLSLRACMILREEYPLSSAFIRKDGVKYRLRATVYDLKPVTRFVIGFYGEIKVNGPAAFKRHLKERLQKIVGVV